MDRRSHIMLRQSSRVMTSAANSASTLKNPPISAITSTVFQPAVTSPHASAQPQPTRAPTRHGSPPRGCTAEHGRSRPAALRDQPASGRSGAPPSPCLLLSSSTSYHFVIASRPWVLLRPCSPSARTRTEALSPPPSDELRSE